MDGIAANNEPQDAKTTAPMPSVVLKSSAVQINDSGQVWRSILIRMPKDAVADDLRDPRIWRVVQAQPVSALVKMDRLLILGFDESWAAEAIVKHATSSQVQLLITRVFGFSAVGDALFNDGTLEVFWDGASYGVRRMADKIPVATGFSSEGLAVDALRGQHGRRVS